MVHLRAGVPWERVPHPGQHADVGHEHHRAVQEEEPAEDHERRGVDRGDPPQGEVRDEGWRRHRAEVPQHVNRLYQFAPPCAAGAEQDAQHSGRGDHEPHPAREQGHGPRDPIPPRVLLRRPQLPNGDGARGGGGPHPRQAVPQAARPGPVTEQHAGGGHLRRVQRGPGHLRPDVPLQARYERVHARPWAGSELLRPRPAKEHGEHDESAPGTARRTR